VTFQKSEDLVYTAEEASNNTKYNLEGRIEKTVRRGRRRKQLLDDLKDKRTYWKLKEEALDSTVENSLWKRLYTCRKTDCRMNERRTDLSTAAVCYSVWEIKPLDIIYLLHNDS
jgi:hypothetical protein